MTFQGVGYSILVVKMRYKIHREGRFYCMRAFKGLIMCCLSLCLTVLLSLMTYTEAGATMKVGVLSVGVMSETTQNITSMKAYKAYQELCERYTQLLMDALKQTGTFEVVRLRHDYEEMSRKKSSSTKKETEYRPNYKRSMADRTIYDYNPANSEEAINMHRAYMSSMAHKAGCRYVIVSAINFLNGSPKDGATVRAMLNVYDVEDMGDSGNLKTTPYYGIVNIPVRRSSSTKAEGVTPKKSRPKSKKSNASNPEDQTAKEQAVIEALAKAATYMSDEMTGNVAKVNSISGNAINLNRGTSQHVSRGDTYMVQAEIQGLDDAFSGTADSRTLNMALIRIIDVQDNSSTAEVIENAGNIATIRVGDKLKPFPKDDVETALSGQYAQFPTKRPENKPLAGKPSSPSKTAQTSNSEEVKAVATEPLPELPPGTVRIGIIKFDNKADGLSDKDVSTITDLFSRMLSTSGKIAVIEKVRVEAIERELNLSLSGIIDPATAAQIGKRASCQYMLMGSVTGLQQRDTMSGRYIRPQEKADFFKTADNLARIAGGNNWGQLNNTGLGIAAGIFLLSKVVEANNAQEENTVTETHEVITNIDVRLVDAQTSSIVKAFTSFGSAAQSDVVTQDGNGDIKTVEANYGSLTGKAIASTAANLSYKIREALTGEQVQIASVNDGEALINRGSDSGVQVGDLFCVYSEGQSGGDTEAIIRVTDVQDAFSTAEIATSVTASYVLVPGSRLEPVLHSDFQKGIWHIKNTRRAQATEEHKLDVSLEELVKDSGRKKKLETSSTDAKKVIRSYRLNPAQEKALITAHSKASKASNARKKYESYKQLSEADINDYLAAYNTGKYALELSMYTEAREWASKALFVNPNYKPAQTLIDKIDNGD